MVQDIDTLRSPVQFSTSAEDIQQAAESAINKSNAVIERVVSEQAPTFKNTIELLAKNNNEFRTVTRALTFLQNASADEKICKASSKADIILDEFEVARDMRTDVYKVVRAVYDNKDEMSQLDEEDRLLVERLEHKLRANGLQLTAEQRTQVERVNKRLVALELEFIYNVDHATNHVMLSRAELDGLPASFFENRRSEFRGLTKKFIVLAQAAEATAVLKHATNEATRKTVYVAQSSHCPKNIALLQEAVHLRLEKAQLFGFATYADYVLNQRMAKTPAAVTELEESLSAKLRPLAEKEMAELCALKRKEVEAAGAVYDGFYEWDYIRYSSQAMANQHRVDMDEIKEYFALDSVLSKVLSLYTTTLGLKVVEASSVLPVWHPSVKTFEVWEADDSAFVGHIYLDLYEREDKYQDIAVWPLRSAVVGEDGTRMTPASAMLASFSEPTETTPVLLTHINVKYLVHALGHAFQNLCSKAKWSQLTAPRDFAEISSQMFVQWVWEPKSLRTLASHYQTGATMPDELIERLVASRNTSGAIRELRQVFRGIYDMDIHRITKPGAIDVVAHYNELSERVALANYGGAHVFKAATFSHIMQGYDCGYYSFMWASVISADMFSARFSGQDSDAEAGAAFRSEILQPGGACDPSASVERFLGRAPSNRAFLQTIGLN
ncbi:metalloendopeptidase [Coemansia sp. RSA 1935]|nr:metalloendopeptidase [Coemansia sp. RSA 1935]